MKDTFCLELTFMLHRQITPSCSLLNVLSQFLSLQRPAQSAAQNALPPVGDGFLKRQKSANCVCLVQARMQTALSLYQQQST
jgi:hypothetical protein